MTTRMQDAIATVGQGDFVTRAEICARLGLKNTQYMVQNIEMAVTLGHLQKLAGLSNGRECWRYYLPGTQLALLIRDLEPDPGYETHSLRMELDEVLKRIREIDDNYYQFGVMPLDDHMELRYLRQQRDMIRQGIMTIEDRDEIR